MGPKTRLRIKHEKNERRILNCAPGKQPEQEQGQERIEKILPAKSFGDLSMEETNILWSDQSGAR